MRRGLALALLVLAAVLAAPAWYDRPPVVPGSWLGAAGLLSLRSIIVSP